MKSLHFLCALAVAVKVAATADALRDGAGDACTECKTNSTTEASYTAEDKMCFPWPVNKCYTIEHTCEKGNCRQIYPFSTCDGGGCDQSSSSDPPWFFCMSCGTETNKQGGCNQTYSEYMMCPGGGCDQRHSQYPTCSGGGCDQTDAYLATCDGGNCDQTGCFECRLTQTP